MKITRKETINEPMFTEKDLNDQYAEYLAFRGVCDYRKRLPQFEDCKYYGLIYRIMKKDGKELLIHSHSCVDINEGVEWYSRKMHTTYNDCYYIKILCVRKDIETLLDKRSACIVTVLESEAIER